MTRRGRSATRAGRPAALPHGDYRPPAPAATAPQGLVVAFHGEDGRRKDYLVSRLPLPGWHPALAEALAERIGPGVADVRIGPPSTRGGRCFVSCGSWRRYPIRRPRRLR